MSDLAQAFADATGQDYTGPTTDATETAKRGDTGKQSAASVLVNIALEKYELGVSEKDLPFGIPKTGPKIVKMLRGTKGSLRAELAKEYFNKTGKAAPQQALADALMVLEGMAQDLEPTTLHMRVAEAEGAHWYDLGDKTGHAIRITGTGWETVERAPVLFKRTALTAAAPEPDPNGTIEELLNLTNAKKEDRPLLVAAMVATFFEDMAHPVVTFSGEQGTGKSTNATRVTQIIDPSSVPLRQAPKDETAWTTAASGSWVVTVDNLSSISPWFSDALCRAVTGDGDVKRALYTDGDLSVFSFRRCIILTGIDLSGLKGDLTERLLRVELERIDSTNRRSERAMLKEYEDSRPRILGALLNLTSAVIRELGSVEMKSSLRLADFHQLIATLDKVLGTKAEDRYRDQFRAMSADSLSADPFVAQLMESITGEFDGTAAQILQYVEDQARKNSTTAFWNKPKAWPSSGKTVTGILTRNAPALRECGWYVNGEGTTREKTKLWVIRSPKESGNGSEDAGNAGNAGNNLPASDPGFPALPALSGTENPEITGECRNAGNEGVKTGQSLEGTAGNAERNHLIPSLQPIKREEEGTPPEKVGKSFLHSLHTCNTCTEPITEYLHEAYGQCFTCASQEGN